MEDREIISNMNFLCLQICWAAVISSHIQSMVTPGNDLNRK